MSENNLQNLPPFKRPEYRIIDFLSTVGYRYLIKVLPCDVYRDVKVPLAEFKNILNESLYGEKYKTKKLSAPTTLYDIIQKEGSKRGKKEAEARGEELEKIQNRQAEIQHKAYKEINKAIHHKGARIKGFILGFIGFIKAAKIKNALDKRVKKDADAIKNKTEDK
jgi:septin family protein